MTDSCYYLAFVWCIVFFFFIKKNRLHHHQRVGNSNEVSWTEPHWSWVAGHDQWSWCWSEWHYWFPWVLELDGKENEGELPRIIICILGAQLVSFVHEWFSPKVSNTMLELSCSNIWMPVNHGSVHRTLIQKQWIVRNYRYYSMPFYRYCVSYNMASNWFSGFHCFAGSYFFDCCCCCCFAMLASFYICWLSFVL